MSLTEDSVHEIPVARALVQSAIPATKNSAIRNLHSTIPYDPFTYTRRASERIFIQGIALGSEETVRVFTTQKKWNALAHKLDRLGDYRPELVLETANVVAIDPRNDAEIADLNSRPEARLITVRDGLDLPIIAAFRLLAARVEPRHPILLKDTLTNAESCRVGSHAVGLGNPDFLDTLLHAATPIGALLCEGIGDAIIVQGEQAPGQSLRLSYNILQAAGARIFKTDYVACPSCGRTLFDLQSTTARIKASTQHLKGVKIAIMGCIVNGPGEMADADFGYVGGAPGKVNLYIGKSAVKFNIPEKEAVDRLVDLIKEHNRWVEPAPVVAEPAEDLLAGAVH